MPLVKSLRRMAAVIVKEFKHIWFDPGFLFLTVLSPAVLLMLLSYIFSFDVEDIKIAVLNQDQSPLSFEYIRDLTADDSLYVVTLIQNYDEVRALFQAGDVDAALVIPPDFERNLKSGQRTPVNLVVDASDVGTAAQVISSIQQRSNIFSRKQMGRVRPSFDVRIRVWFNANLDSQHSMIPGLMSLVLILPAMAIALGVSREKESGTFETLVTTPIRGYEFLLGKLFVYLSLGLVGMLLAVAVAVFWFRVPFRGQLSLYILLTTDYLLALMGFCLVVAHFITSQRAVTPAILLTLFIPSFFLTGLIMPVDKTSIVSRLMSFLLPSTHFIVVSRAVMLKGLRLPTLLPEASIMFGMGLLAVIFSITAFAKQVHRG